MTTLVRHIVFTLMACLMLAASIQADSSLRGNIGVDLESYQFVSDLKDTIRAYNTDRTRSSHFLNMSLAGPIGNSHFGDYSLRFGILGAYFDSRTASQVQSDYISPKLTDYAAHVTLLAEKKYPLELFRSDARAYMLRYEPNNKTDRSRLQPELSVVRRYQADRTSTGLRWTFTPSTTVRILSDYKHETSEIGRIYDFDEDLDIWVNFQALNTQPFDSVYTIIFENKLEDSVTITIINLDSLYGSNDPKLIVITNLPPGFLLNDSLYIGRHEIQVSAPGLNSYTNEFEATSNVKLGIEFHDPAAPNDIDQTRDVFSALVNIDGGGKFSDEFYLEYSDQEEFVQDQITELLTSSNTMNYKFSSVLMGNMLTTFTDNTTIISTNDPQLSQSLTNQTTFTLDRQGGFSGSLLHSFGRAASDDGRTDLTTYANTFTARATRPFRKWRYLVGLRGNVSLLSDDSAYSNNQYSAELSNSMELRAAGIRMRPVGTLEYTKNVQKSPDQSSSEIESQLTVVSEFPPSRIIGDLRLKTDYTYRNRRDAAGSTAKSKYLIDGFLKKKLSESAKISLMASQEWEMFGGSSPTPGGESGQAQQTLHKSSYKIDVQVEPATDVALNGNYMLIKQGGTKIQRFGLSLIAEIPGIHLPLKSFLQYEQRDLEGVEGQTQFMMETKTSYHIRKITITVGHSYRSENQLFEEYSVHEIKGKIFRQFDVF